MTDYGRDLQVIFNAQGAGDITPGGLEVTGRRVLANRLLCRQTTPRGSVQGAPNDCFDVRDWLSAGFSPTEMSQLRGRIKSELQNDVGVHTVDVKMTYDSAAKKLTIVESIESSAGPFVLTIGVTSLTVEALITET